MCAAIQLREHDAVTEIRTIADQAFSRAAGAPLIGGNSVRLLKNAHENYPAWLDAIGAAKRHIHFESYIIHCIFDSPQSELLFNLTRNSIRGEKV
jgi:phosphatidylserine/phosphatidylglycerophosphate/cardiolipin synthase-like enzyme